MLRDASETGLSIRVSGKSAGWFLKWNGRFKRLAVVGSPDTPADRRQAGYLYTGKDAVEVAGCVAEASNLRVAKQYGLGYIQLMIMEDQQLVEKHAREAGLGDVAVDWSTFRSSDVMNDALISGNLDFASLGPTGIITIWSRTRGNIDVRAASGLNAMAGTLNVRDPAINSLRDFNESHRIAVPAVKVSGQATALQIAAAKEFGKDEFEQLDPLTVSLSHPDATAMMIASGSEIVANFSSPPFSDAQFQNPEVRTILTSDEILGGPISFNVIAVTNTFREANPKLYGAFLAALRKRQRLSRMISTGLRKRTCV